MSWATFWAIISQTRPVTLLDKANGKFYFERDIGNGRVCSTFAS
jgi:hypothetical protein